MHHAFISWQNIVSILVRYYIVGIFLMRHWWSTLTLLSLNLSKQWGYPHTKSVPSLIRVKSNQISEHFLILVSLNKCMRREQPIQRRVLEGGNNTCVDSSVKSEACLNPTQGALKMEKVHLCPKDSIMRWCIKGKSVNWTGMWHAGLTNISWLNVIP